ncbi:MAG TPA: ATP-binding cassette domain-containing protein [Acidimicrobiales bacterium]|nr:ATP-binding cassette domain-containing protein [Acidimicrobiales bacterium]
MTNAIEAHDLKKTFGGEVRALDGVSFAVEEGTIFGLLGPNGAGKTTAVRILTTILSPDSGTGLVLGYDVVAQADRVRTLIGLAGQYAAVDENLTGRENLTMVGRLNHLARDVVAKRETELLEQFGLTDASDRPVKTYSGGMRRRLDVAAALVARPKVLFLDEPTSGLDPHSRVDVWGMIDRLVGEGTSVLLTTQYLEEADTLARDIAVVDHGRVIAEGTPAQLKADLGATVLDVGLPDAELARQVAGLLGSVGAKSPTVVGTIVELPVDDGPRVAMEVLRLLDQHGLVPTTFRIREPSLDDVFMALTGKRTEADDEDETTSIPTDGKRRRRRAPAAAGASMDGGPR